MGSLAWPLTNEAVVLYLGQIGASEEQELLLPLPDGLSRKETKRISATLAWLSPVNWQHRQYRAAALSFTKPGGDIPDLGTPSTLPSAASTRGAATTQRLEWDTAKAFGAGQGSNIQLRVSCREQAGGLHGERIDFAVALSLWVAPALAINVYQQVRDQIQIPIQVQPTS